MFGRVRKRDSGPFSQYVLNNLGDDEFVRQHKLRDEEFVIFFYIGLTISLERARELIGGRRTKKIFRGTNPDILCAELFLFLLLQAKREVMRKAMSEDAEVTDLEVNLSLALDPFTSIGKEFYPGFADWYNERSKIYGKNPKAASQALALYLAAMSGSSRFEQIALKEPSAFGRSLELLPIVLPFGKLMVPAFIESVQRVLDLRVDESTT